MSYPLRINKAKQKHHHREGNPKSTHFFSDVRIFQIISCNPQLGRRHIAYSIDLQKSMERPPMCKKLVSGAP
jgi:hypothetical protein